MFEKNLNWSAISEVFNSSLSMISKIISKRECSKKWYQKGCDVKKAIFKSEIKSDIKKSDARKFDIKSLQISEDQNFLDNIHRSPNALMQESSSNNKKVCYALLFVEHSSLSWGYPIYMVLPPVWRAQLIVQVQLELFVWITLHWRDIQTWMWRVNTITDNFATCATGETGGEDEVGIGEFADVEVGNGEVGDGNG